MKSIIRPQQQPQQQQVQVQVQQRGRPTKVTKPSVPARGGRPARHGHLGQAPQIGQASQASQLVAAHLATTLGLPSHIDHDQHGQLDQHQHQHQQHHDPHDALQIDHGNHDHGGLDHTNLDHANIHGHIHGHEHDQQQHLDHDHDIKVDGSGEPNPFDDARMAPEDYAAAAAAAVMSQDMSQDDHGEAEADADMDDDDHSGNTSGLTPHVDLTNPANILSNGRAPGVQGHQHSDMHQPLGQPHQLQPQAQMGGPQQMQAAHHSMDPALVKTTEELAHESGYQELNVESALAKRLAREPGHRHAHQRRPEQGLNLARRSNVEALFAHIAGEPARTPCKNCHKGHGPWTSCIVVDGQMCGSCANCWFNASGARCSFHETRNPQVVQQHHNLMPAGTAGLPVDASYRFTTPHALIPSAHTAAMGSVSNPLLSTTNSMIQDVINKAMGDVRMADKATRQLIMIETTAKQLALQIAEYEDMVNNQEAPGGPGSSQQVMGDDSGA
ncbi:hypothetical protein B0T17DRAFT_230598 [Bombardia bombarda]|uniref:Uncharacterized protein n=1 Tax=Bombardia bombarda TaxID=252184 RepID=A0AA39XBR8_9PEZI|nr:hypothetical protein B0T17DRAFT_230598 [Bombardia bombarda]